MKFKITYAAGAAWIIPLPLATAFKKNRSEIARFLIENGADPEAYCKKDSEFVKKLKGRHS